MIEPWTFGLAFVLAPLVVVGLGYLAVRLHERSGPHHPAE
jgi:hypothetical protein